MELVTISEPTKRIFYQQLYHRRLRRLFVIDLKLGKFKPEHKGQMGLYLKYLKKYEMQPGEEDPMGLLLCSEGNTKHIELLMLDEKNIKVAQYLTILPDKQWFIDLTVHAIANGVNPGSPDFLLFDHRHTQPLVDAAFLAEGVLRAPTQIWGCLDPETRTRQDNNL